MLDRSASLAMSTSVLKALPGKLDIKRRSPSILCNLLPCPEMPVGCGILGFTVNGTPVPLIPPPMFGVIAGP